jgi:pimeloyl-ACP methyl ester carboxylesterase/DNA-binding CsgD family transcriptional regulator
VDSQQASSFCVVAWRKTRRLGRARFVHSPKVPFTMEPAAQPIRFATSRDGTRLAFVSMGSGPPLLWLGHWIRHLEFDWASPVWRPWLNLLTRNHRVIRFDWRGCGLSDRDGVAHSLEKHVEDLEAVVEAAELDRFVLFGQAGGGSACIEYAARHPERISRLVLFGAQIRGRFVRNDSKFRAEGEALFKMMELGWNNETPAFGKFFTTLHMPDTRPDLFQSYDKLRRQTSSPGNAIALLRAYFEADASEAIKHLNCRTLVLHAREDAVVPFDEGRLAASLITDARFIPLASRNHILLEHEPAWAQLSAELATFLHSAEQTDLSLPLDSLTSREREILELVARGWSNPEIGEHLGISEKTVRNHVSLVFNKLTVTSRAQAVALARDAGLGSSASYRPLRN